MRWIKSYPAHPAFIHSHRNAINEFLSENAIAEKDALLLFTAHGIPQKFVTTGDLYQSECLASFHAVSSTFPKALSRLCFQSKFGPGEWLRPYTIDVCKEITEWNQGRNKVVFVPISFTSDHIETLCEIENDYMPVIRENGLEAYRVPALTLRSDWVDALAKISSESNLCNNQMLIRGV